MKLLREIFWTFLSASDDADPSDPDDEPGVTLSVHDVDGENGMYPIMRHGPDGSVQFGHVERTAERPMGHHQPIYDVVINHDKVYGRPVSQMEWTMQDFMSVTEILVNYLQDFDDAYVEFCDEDPGERVLSSAFGQLADAWQTYPPDIDQLSLSEWEGAYRGALVAHDLSTQYSSEVEAENPPYVGLAIRAGGYPADVEAALDGVVDRDVGVEVVIDEMRRITGECPPLDHRNEREGTLADELAI